MVIPGAAQAVEACPRAAAASHWAAPAAVAFPVALPGEEAFPGEASRGDPRLEVAFRVEVASQGGPQAGEACPRVHREEAAFLVALRV